MKTENPALHSFPFAKRTRGVEYEHRQKIL